MLEAVLVFWTGPIVNLETGHRSELKSTHCGALLVSTVRCFNGRGPTTIRQAK